MRLLGHPVHTAFVHFPIALLGTSLLFDSLGLVLGGTMWWTISFWNMALGLCLGGLAAATGLIDSATVDPASPASRALNTHILAVFGALCCYGGALALRMGEEAPTGLALPGTLALEVAGLALLLLGGWLGGELVYRHGVGAADRSQDPAQADFEPEGRE